MSGQEPFAQPQPETRLAQAGSRWDERTGGVSLPIHASTTFRHPALGESTGFDYSRTSNPTRKVLEDTLADLEGGARALAFSSGMAAIDCVIRLFGAGDRIVVLEDLYGGTWRLLEAVARKSGIEVCYLPQNEFSEHNLRSLAPFAGVFLENPTNPTLRVVDIAPIAQIARSVGALCIVDNTFLTAYLQRPLELGADISLYSASKYLGGHNDVLAGAVVTQTAELGERLAYLQNTTGAVLSPFDSWLLIRGLKTLPLRLKQQQQNALEIAQWLSTHPAVAAVHYPGLPQHPSHNIQAQQSNGFGGMLSFELRQEEQVAQVIRKLRLWIFAESLGGVESLLTLPCKQTHADVPLETRLRLGVTNTLFRLSVGIESSADLIADLAQALEST